MDKKFLLFDLDHTLMDFDQAEEVALTDLLIECQIADIEVYKDYYKPMNQAMWKSLELKQITKPELVNTRFAKLFNFPRFCHLENGALLMTNITVILFWIYLLE